MFAVIVNTLAILAACCIGMLFKKGIPDKVNDATMKALGLCTLVIGVQGTIKEPNVLILILSAVVGVTIGELLDLDGKVNHATEWILQKFANVGSGHAAKIANAFVTSCLIMSVGAMTIVGSLNAGLAHDYDMLFTKSLLDFCSGIMLTASMGVGVFGSALFTLVFQGAIVLAAQYIAPFLSDAMILEMTCTGSLMILGIGLNMLGITKLKVLNFLPGLLVVPFALALMQLLGLY